MKVYPGLMEVRPVDPRDTDSEIESPVYRVYFWESLGEGPNAAFKSDEYEITGAADVYQVLRWAEANANGTFTAHLVMDKTLIRLSGEDPTAP